MTPDLRAELASVLAEMRMYGVACEPLLHEWADRIEAALTSHGGGGEVVDYTDIANRAQEVTGRSIWPSTVKAVLDAAALSGVSAPVGWRERLEALSNQYPLTSGVGAGIDRAIRALDALTPAAPSVSPAVEGGLLDDDEAMVPGDTDDMAEALAEIAEALDSNNDRDSILATIDSLKDMVRNRRLATPEQPAIDIDACVDRFLGWRLPDDFAPDDGISFTPITNPAWLHDNWPIGTNLLTAVQARAMLEYVLNWTAGAPSAQQPLDGPANNAGVATGSRNGPPSESVTRGNPPSNLEQPGSAVQGEASR